MIDTTKYMANWHQFIKFKTGELIMANVFQHKDTKQIYVFNPILMKVVDGQDGDFNVFFVKWLPLGNDNILYPINLDDIMTSGGLSDEAKRIYEEAISSDHETNLRDVNFKDIKNILN